MPLKLSTLAVLLALIVLGVILYLYSQHHQR